jgi:hypothetical protein
MIAEPPEAEPTPMFETSIPEPETPETRSNGGAQ